MKMFAKCITSAITILAIIILVRQLTYIFKNEYDPFVMNLVLGTNIVVIFVSVIATVLAFSNSKDGKKQNKDRCGQQKDNRKK